MGPGEGIDVVGLPELHRHLTSSAEDSGALLASFSFFRS